MNRIYGIGDEEELANDLQEEMKRMIPVEVLDKIRAEIADGKIDFDLDIGQEIHYNRAIDDVLDIIDKYRIGSNETQTNENVYDIGGHMYGAMGGDVIMDILAGKGKK